MREEVIRKSDLIYDDKIRTWRLKRKYGKFNRQAIIIDKVKDRPTEPLPANQLQLF